MKKIISLLILLLLPILVFAKECDSNSIKILSMEKGNITGLAEEGSGGSTFDGKDINLNVILHEVGDSITYNLEIQNDSDEDVMLDIEDFLPESNYLEYSVYSNNNTNIFGAHSTKTVRLKVEYSEEVPASELENGKLNNSSTHQLLLSSKVEEQELSSNEDEVHDMNAANNIDVKNLDTVENPKTGVIGVTIVLFTFITVGLAIYIKIKYDEKHMERIFKPFILLILLVPLYVYAICECSFNLKVNVVIEPKEELFNTIKTLASEENSCVTKYDGEVTDQVGATVIASNVYFDKCADKRNIIFNNMCWQVIRTTETGGTKLIYNGEPVDGKCESTRENHKGIAGTSGSTQTLDEEYLYGSSFTYDTENNTFTLTDTITATWSDSTYENLLGKFTCKNTTGTCTTLYNVNGYKTDTTAHTAAYTIGNTNYAQIGSGPFNAYYGSPAMVGYMFNKVYNNQKKSPGTTEYKYGSSFTYNNGMYTLTGTTQNISNISTGISNMANTRYTCWNTTGKCDTISFIYGYVVIDLYYIDLKDGKGIDDAINDMLFADDVNKYNSSIKGIIYAWYKQNLLSKTNMLEDTVYCNARNITDIGGWSVDGNFDTSHNLYFNSMPSNDSLVCSNIKDRFAVSNNQAKLTYPVGLITNEEKQILNNTSLLKTPVTWWLITASLFDNYASYTSVQSYNDLRFGETGGNNNGIRLSISLKRGTVIWSGTGSETDPWIIR